jgi:triosephosphate isomerase
MEELTQKVADAACKEKIYVFPPSTALDYFETPITVGAQNAYPTVNGAYTGEIGIEQLDEFKIKTILIGHSERREIMHEGQEIIAEKFSFFKEQGFEIIYCIGEPLEVREQGDEAVMEYLLAQFVGIDTSYEKLIVAYEPIWAIGTGRSATVEEIASTHSALRESIDKPLLYGGSAKPANIREIIDIDNVDGVLVGSASLSVDSFYSMITA